MTSRQVSRELCYFSSEFSLYTNFRKEKTILLNVELRKHMIPNGEIFEQVVTVCTKIFVSATAITVKRNGFVGRKDMGERVFSAEAHRVESPHYPNFTRRLNRGVGKLWWR